MTVPGTHDHALAHQAARRARDRAIVRIAIFKLIKDVRLIAVARRVFALKLLRHDVADRLTHLLQSMRTDPDNRFTHRGLMKVGGFDDRKLEEISGGYVPCPTARHYTALL